MHGQAQGSAVAVAHVSLEKALDASATPVGASKSQQRGAVNSWVSQIEHFLVTVIAALAINHQQAPL